VRRAVIEPPTQDLTHSRAAQVVSFARWQGGNTAESGAFLSRENAFVAAAIGALGAYSDEATAA
jgi:hypothetical protein